MMEFTALSQVLGGKGEGLGVSGWISWGQSECEAQINTQIRERGCIGLLRGRTCRCFSQCYQEVPLSTWDFWPRKEIALAFACRNCSGSLLVSLQKSHVGAMDSTAAQWLEN